MARYEYFVCFLHLELVRCFKTSRTVLGNLRHSSSVCLRFRLCSGGANKGANANANAAGRPKGVVVAAVAGRGGRAAGRGVGGQIGRVRVR
eukprot:6194863-Pleurochrysis_carterae.AAC.1